VQMCVIVISLLLRPIKAVEEEDSDVEEIVKEEVTVLVAAVVLAVEALEEAVVVPDVREVLIGRRKERVTGLPSPSSAVSLRLASFPSWRMSTSLPCPSRNPKL